MSNQYKPGMTGTFLGYDDDFSPPEDGEHTPIEEDEKIEVIEVKDRNGLIELDVKSLERDDVIDTLIPEEINFDVSESHAKAKEAIGQEIVPQETADVMDLVNSSNLLQAAEQLSRIIHRSEGALACVLSRVDKDNLYTELGYSGNKTGFENYLREELSIKYRKARYLIRTHNYLADMGLKPEEIIDELTWSKAKELTKIGDNPEVLEEAIEQGKEANRQELIEFIKDQVEEGEGDTPTTTNRRQFAISLFEDEAELMQEAIDLVAEQIGQDESTSQCVYTIVNEWLITNANVEVPLEEAINNLEARYGVSVSVGDDQAEVEEVTDSTETETVTAVA